jgi:hypothetical protein
MIKNPSVILFSACSFMRYCAGLHPTDTQDLINSRVDLMVKTAVKILGKEDVRAAPALMGADHGDAEVDGSELRSMRRVVQEPGREDVVWLFSMLCEVFELLFLLRCLANDQDIPSLIVGAWLVIALW